MNVTKGYVKLFGDALLENGVSYPVRAFPPETNSPSLTRLVYDCNRVYFAQQEQAFRGGSERNAYAVGGGYLHGARYRSGDRS